MPDGGLCHGCACVDADIGCSASMDRRDGFMKKGKVRIMASALFSKRPRRVDVMKGYEPMYDATLQECSLAMLVPMYALTVRRLHDLALSGWLALVLYALIVVGYGLIIGSMVSDIVKGLDPSAPSPLGIIILLLAVVVRLAIMCVPSRRRHPVVANGSLSASQTGASQYPGDPNGR